MIRNIKEKSALISSGRLLDLQAFKNEVKAGVSEKMTSLRVHQQGSKAVSLPCERQLNPAIV